jgi:1-deoxy-D-xylulose 5-phosphate reductoisomerase
MIHNDRSRNATTGYAERLSVLIIHGRLAHSVVTKVEAECTAQLGQQRMRQLRHALTRLRELTDPYQ